MWEFLDYAFMRQALAAGLLASVACGVVGTLVVVNRLVFLAGGVAHAAYGGVGLAFFLGLPVLPVTIGFTLGVSGVIGALTRRHDERADTIIGVLWASGMALGVLLLDLTPGYNVDLLSYLFGSILTVPMEDVLVMAGFDLLMLGLVLRLYGDFLCLSFDREYAASAGVKVGRLHYLLLAMLAVSVVMLLKVVGLILVIALLTIPPYLAEQGARSLAGMMLQASLYSVAFCWLGLLAAWQLDVTSGAAIIAVASLTFFGLHGWRWLMRQRGR